MLFLKSNMKTYLFSLVLIAVFSISKSQMYKKVWPTDTLFNKFNSTPPALQQAPFTGLSSLQKFDSKIKQNFNFSFALTDHMPIVDFGGFDDIPIVKDDGYYNMPIKKLNNEGILSFSQLKNTNIPTYKKSEN